MNTLEFLQRVLPSEGVYVSAIIGDRTQQGFFSTVEELAKSVIATDKRGSNTYYAISAFIEKGKRTQDNTRATKVVALDVDCGEGKPYPSWKEGLVALGQFVTALSLPKPMIVHSGNGLHVYWVLNRELPPEEWRPLALAMKAATQAQAFHVDPAVPADSARVLRPVGTTNRKGGNPVKLLIDAPDVAPEQLAQCLTNYMADMPVAQPVSQRQRPSGLLASLAVKSDFAPTNPEAVASKCAQIAYAVANQADKTLVNEPFWYAVMGVAAFCENPLDTAIAWSKDHPTFSVQETEKKILQWQTKMTGPATCERFMNLAPERCKKCKFNGGRITAPTQLGVQYVEAPIAPTAPNVVAFEVPMPKPFKRTTSGIKMTIDKTDIEICPFDIYPVSYGKDEVLGYETVRYHWNRPHMGWRELAFRQAYLAEGSREFSSCIADQGIVLKNKATTDYFQQMLRSYMNELRQMRSMTNIYSTMGWKENFTQFVLGDTLLRRNDDGSVSEERITMSSTTQRVSDSLYTQSGSLEEWVRFTSVMDKAKLDAHVFAMGVAFSSVLYAFAGIKGAVVSLYGPTGGGKTLAQYWQQSIYGNPDKLHFAAKFTQNTLFARLGLYCHLPMTIDEATLMDDKLVGEFIYWVSQGKDKARLNRNAEEREAKVWAAPTIVSTNKSLAAKLAVSGMESDAQLARLMEVNFDAHNLFTKDSTTGKRIYDFLMANHGRVGKEYIKRLMEMGEDKIRAVIDKAFKEFDAEYDCKFEGKERFIQAIIVLADVANKLALEAGLVMYDPKAGTNFGLSQVGGIRKMMVENQVDCFDLIGEYLNEVADAHLVVSHTADQRPMVDFNRLPRNGIKVRFDLFKTSAVQPVSRGVVFFERTNFKRWLALRGADWKTFMQSIAAEHADATPKSKKVFLGKDSPIKIGQTYVVGINLCHPRLQGILDDMDQAMDATLMDNLTSKQPVLH